MMRSQFAVVTLVTLLAGARAIAASPSEEAESLIRRGNELRHQGKDERALPLYQKAYDLLPSPRTAGQLGLAEMSVGYWLEADQHLGEALQEPDHPWVSKNRRALEDARAQVRKNVAEVAIAGSPAGATVTVNHKPAGALPLPAAVRVARGKVDVEVSAPGYVTATRSLTVGGGDRQQVDINLDKAAAASPVANGDVAKPTTTPPVLTPAAPPPPQTPTPVAPPAPPSDDSLKLRVGLGWGLGIAGAVALVGAVYETVAWQSHRSDFNNNMGCNVSLPNRGVAGCSGLYDSIHSAETLAIIGYIAAGALGAGSAALLLTAKPSEPSTSALACAPTLGSSPFLSCRWLF
jgi:hypothetical protein